MFPIRKNQPANQLSISNSIATGSGGDYATGADSAGTDSISFDGPQHVECPTCIDPPGDDTSGDECTASDEYTLSAALNNTTASTTSSDISTWRLSPFWGGIIQEVETILENTRQTDSPVHREFPYHETFDLDRRVTIETTLMPNSQLSFSLTMYDMISRLYYTSTSFAVSNARIKATADAIRVEGVYTIAQDNFTITDFQFDNLDTDVNASSNFGPIIGFAIHLYRVIRGITNSDLEGDVVTAIKDQVANAIDEVNRNSPNMFLRSLLDFPELQNILPLLDQAIMQLLQDDVSATLEVALPSCGDIDRDGLIGLNISTN